MPRTARIVIPGLAHHCTQRGNNREDVFFSETDRARYLTLLATHAEAHDVRILAYCLMSNHVHIAAIPSSLDGLGEMMKQVAGRYAQSVNAWYDRCGHLWQGRFYSCPMDGAHTAHALRYIEMNPVRAGLVREAWSFRWSSAAVHVGERRDSWNMLDLDAFTARWSAMQWREILDDAHDSERVDRELRVATRTGTPQVSAEELKAHEAQMNMPLRKFRRGEEGGQTPFAGS